ncbi:DNA cytosine methyltransferase [Streptomyces sp. NPDC001123]
MTFSDTEGRSGAVQFTMMDLFAGCGGFSEGFRSGFRSVAAVEIDLAAAATYKANHRPEHLLCGDIGEFDPYPFAERVDVITGAPPCQGFSGLGRTPRDDPRNGLWREYLRAVAVVKPKVFVLENVDRFAKSPEFAFLTEEARPTGLLSDYHLHTEILNSADYGVPQARRRTIVIGSHRDLGTPIRHPAPTHSKEPLAADDSALFSTVEVLAPWVPVTTIFQRSAQMKINGTTLPARHNSLSMPGPYQTSELHIGRTPTKLSMARYRAIPPGGNRRNLTDKFSADGEYLSTTSWDNHITGSADVMGRLHADRPSVTIRTEFFKPEKGRYLHPWEHRPITHYEAALIQGFPDNYQWYGSKLEIARQIGNAVPVGLGRALARAIYERLATVA